MPAIRGLVNTQHSILVVGLVLLQVPGLFPPLLIIAFWFAVGQRIVISDT